jgi:crossover junction endodeoxyribonuclease RusA
LRAFRRIFGQLSRFKENESQSTGEPGPALAVDDNLDIRFPVEFLVEGTPLSLQAKSAAHKEAWKDQIRQAYAVLVPLYKWATQSPVSVTIYYFPDGPVTGDIDNIVKLILDAMNSRIFVDDNQVRKLTVQRFGSDEMVKLENPSPKLAEALETPPPVVYIRVDIDGSLDDRA